MTIEVFATNVADHLQAKRLQADLQRHFPGSKINFDLHDSDKVLRIAGTGFSAEQVMLLVRRYGVACKRLE